MTTRKRVAVAIAAIALTVNIAALDYAVITTRTAPAAPASSTTAILPAPVPTIIRFTGPLPTYRATP